MNDIVEIKVDPSELKRGIAVQEIELAASELAAGRKVILEPFNQIPIPQRQPMPPEWVLPALISIGGGAGVCMHFNRCRAYGANFRNRSLGFRERNNCYSLATG